MCKVAVLSVEDGLIPSEKVVIVPTLDGNEELSISTQQLYGRKIEAALVREDNGKFLVELPRETVSGRRRVWVSALVGG